MNELSKRIAEALPAGTLPAGAFTQNGSNDMQLNGDYNVIINSGTTINNLLGIIRMMTEEQSRLNATIERLTNRILELELSKVGNDGRSNKA